MSSEASEESTEMSMTSREYSVFGRRRQLGGDALDQSMSMEVVFLDLCCCESGWGI